MSLLEVNGISVEFHGQGITVRALDDVSLTVEKGEIVAVVGESGCGKTTLARCILGLQRTVSGTIDLLGERVRGPQRRIAEKVGMVWQDPFASLDPRWPVGRSALEPATLTARAVSLDELMQEVGLSKEFANRFPHQLSGGQRQRIAIARAVALRPPLVICDEPTAALDLSIRAQILNLLKSLREELDSSFLYISHDLSTVRFLADRVAVMYLGKIVELGETEAVFANPRHPYTKALLDSAPTLETIGMLPEAPEGELPDPAHRPPGCPFAPRCPNAQPVCSTKFPEASRDEDREYYCYFPVAT
jgi:oligopeptide/dipeptide ABC transporter ATP-binding protein